MTLSGNQGRTIGLSSIGLLLVLGLCLLLTQPVSAKVPTAQTLLVEAATLLRQVDAADGEDRVKLLRQAQERLRRIVADYPDSDLARQLSGPGVAVMGGSTLSLVAVEQRLTAELGRPQHLNRYGEVQVHSDGTVTIHGRQWMRCSLGQRWEPVPGRPNEGTCAGEALFASWDDARRLARELNQRGGFAGHRDWRLPSIEELEMLRLCSSGLTEGISEIGNTESFSWCSGDFEHPTIDTGLFPNTPSSYFWSGSPSAGSSNSAWSVSFLVGYAGSYNRSNGGRVRLVRGGQ